MFHRDGRRLHDFRISWEKAAADVGLPRLLFHDLRRSGARNLRRAGVPESTIMQMGGWKTRAMFLRYDITDESDLAAASSAYETFLDEKGTRKVASLNAARTQRNATGSR